MRSSLLTAVAAAVGLVCWSSAATNAQGPAHPAGAHAPAASHGSRLLLERGIAALDAHDLNAAAQLLTDAYRQSQRPEVLYHLGRLALAEGRALDAYDLMRRYLADPSREADEVATRAAEELLKPAPPASGSLSVLSEPGALVLVDHHAAATLPLLLPLLVAPGVHTLQLQFPSKTMEAPVQVELGRRTEVRMSRASDAVVVSVLPAILYRAAASGLPQEAGPKLAEALELAANDEQYTLLNADLLLAKGPESQRCLANESCLRELAAKHKLDYVLLQDVQAKPQPSVADWKCELRLLHKDVRESAARLAASCDACAITQAAVWLKVQAAQVLSKGLGRARGSLHLTAEPAASAVRIDDRRLSSLPFSETVWAGTYQVTATHPGYRREERSVEVAAGKTAEVQLTLEKELAEAVRKQQQPPPPLAAPGRPRWRLAVGGVMLGVGAGLGAAGIAGVALDSTCVGPQPCALLYDTISVGAFSLVSGVLLMGSGALLIALPPRKRPSPHP